MASRISRRMSWRTPTMRASRRPVAISHKPYTAQLVLVDAHDAVLRDPGQPGDLPRRLDASTTPPAAPWLMGAATMPDIIDGYKWELYNIAEDYSQYNDLAAQMLDKLKEMQQLFYAEAEKNLVPLDNAMLLRLMTPK